ncbi:MAG: iron-containing alcohol dehydrogenase [Planctomycetes bacterium]|nr:iron-containing alcohol dehydrogenase [Planctomycetota bacterium]
MATPAASLEPFDHDPRTRVVFGPGTIERLGDLVRELGAPRVLLVTDPGIVRAGHAGHGRRSLEAAGLEVAVFDGVEENPTTAHVERGVAFAREARIDSIVGLGGGSAMDCAKGINFILTSGGEMKDYWGVGKAKGPMLPMVAVPTTAGTGSESQSFALISDAATRQKMACGDKRAACRVAVLDPELTVTQPRAVAAATGIDALSHAVETLVTRRRNPVSRMLSLEAWRLLEPSLERVLGAPGDLEARGRMLLGASLAGAAIESSMLGAAHAAANPLTARFGVVHGHAIGLLLPHVVRFNAPAAGDEYRALAVSSEALARRLEDLHAATGLPRRLGDFGVEEGDLQDLARDAARQWTAQFNPRPVAEQDFLEIYRCAL